MTAVTPRLVSLNVGMPRDVAWQGRTVHTGILKLPVAGPVMARRLNLDGDGQGDLAGHGGEMRAVLVYQRQSYEYWREFLHRDDLKFGQLGENFTVDGLADAEVHIGDRYRIGEAEFEVTQPRVTCFRSGLQIGEPRMPALLVSERRPGFYLRVLREGLVTAGDEISRTTVGRHRMSVVAIDALLYLPGHDPGALERAIDIPALSPGWQQSFHELLDAARSGRPAQRPAVGVEPAWTGFRRLRVARVVHETANVESIYLEAEKGPLPSYRPGQFLTVRVDGAATPPPVRSYSLSSSPDPGHYRISVKREPHGLVSGFLHAHLRVGMELEAAPPSGEFGLTAETDRPAMLLSGGIGVTPVLAMLDALAASGSSREVWWLHTVRTPADLAFADEVATQLSRLDRHQEHIFFTAPPEGTDLTDPRFHRGRLNADALRALKVPADAEAYLCGPAGFMTAMEDALVAVGLNSSRIHTELFGSLPPINPGVVGAAARTPHAPAGPAGTGPQVTFARSGLTVRWRADFGTLLPLAEACDVPTRWSCRFGVCHTCETQLVSGAVDYEPQPLEPPAAGSILICCSHPTEDAVLDL